MVSARLRERARIHLCAEPDELKKAVKVLCSGTPDFFDRDAAEVGDKAGCLSDKCGFASLSAMWDGCEIGRVRFDEHPVKRNLPGGLADVLRLWKADVAGERDHEAHFNRTL